MSKKIATSHGAMTAEELREEILAQAERDESFRQRLLAGPHEVLEQDYNITLPENIQLHVHEDSASTAHLVLPRSKKLSEAELQASSGGFYY